MENNSMESGKKDYVKLKLCIVKLKDVDIITTSGGGWYDSTEDGIRDLRDLGKL